MALLLGDAQPGDIQLGAMQPGSIGATPVLVRKTYLIVTIDGVQAANVLSCTVKYGFAQGASEATLHCQDLPQDSSGNVLGSADGYGSEVEIQIGSDATFDPTNIPVCFRGYIRGFHTGTYPKETTVICKGPLYQLEEWEPNVEAIAADDSKPGIDFEDLIGVAYGSFAGATLNTITTAVLSRVGTVTIVPPVLADPPHMYGFGKDSGPENFTWRTGVDALSYLNEIYKASEGYRLFDSSDGTMYLAQIRGRPQGDVFDMGLSEGYDILNQSAADRTVSTARNQVIVEGYDDGAGPDTSGVVNFANQWQPDPVTSPRTYRVQNHLIESDAFATAIANYWGDEVSREQIKITIDTWRDDIIGPAATCYINATNRLGVGDAAFVQGVTRDYSRTGAITQTITVITGGRYWYGPSVPN